MVEFLGCSESSETIDSKMLRFVVSYTNYGNMRFRHKYLRLKMRDVKRRERVLSREDNILPSKQQF